MKIVAVIPAHMASVRFPGKILFPFHGLPMIEHVRRRALMSKSLADVVVATCDESIAFAIRGFGGKVIMTSKEHKNGTTRTAEAIKNIDCSHVMLLQGDEPLLLPRHVDSFAKAIEEDRLSDAWNATGPIDYAEELDRNSFVKCAVGEGGRILYCFRRSPCYSPYDQQRSFIRKILGIIAYKKDFLIQLTGLAPAKIEEAEFIEQMRIIENGYKIRSVEVAPSLPSVNVPEEADQVLEYINSDNEQRELLFQIVGKNMLNQK
jgi:3-deoxy-manno-octulosonate cytidylyltransferase (CMP-KDO synthetase)